MKKPILTAVALLVTAVAVLGTKAVKSHFDAVRNGVKKAVRSATPPGYEVERLKGLIDRISEDVAAYGDKIAETETQVEAQRAEAARLERSVAADRVDLKAERALLAGPDGEFSIRGTPYSRAQIEASAQARIQRIQRDTGRLATVREGIQRLEGDVSEARTRLRDAAGLRDEKLRDLEMLKTRLENAALAGELDEVSKPLRDGEISRTQSELGASLAQFEERVNREERRLARDHVPAVSPVIIQHQDNPLRPSVLEEIDRLLGGEAASTNTVPPAVERDAGE